MSDAEQPTIEVTVNGAARPVPAGSSVADLIAALGFQPKQVAVERNKVIVRRDDHACTCLLYTSDAADE